MAHVETIFGKPIAKANHYLATPHGIVKDSVIRAYEQEFLRQCVFYRDKQINVPFALNIDVYFATNASDLDNILKTALDCLQECGAITNDNLCMKIAARKYVSKRPRLEFSITPIETTLFDMI